MTSSTGSRSTSSTATTGALGPDPDLGSFIYGAVRPSDACSGRRSRGEITHIDASPPEIRQARWEFGGTVRRRRQTQLMLAEVPGVPDVGNHPEAPGGPSDDGLEGVAGAVGPPRARAETPCSRRGIAIANASGVHLGKCPGEKSIRVTSDISGGSPHGSPLLVPRCRDGCGGTGFDRHGGRSEFDGRHPKGSHSALHSRRASTPARPVTHRGSEPTDSMP